MASSVWGAEIDEVYDETSAGMFDPAVLGPTVDLLAELAEGGPALELAIGTGRVALALQARGVEVAGIDLSTEMVGALRRKPGADTVRVTVGDMTTATAVAPGTFQLVYLVFNGIMNVTTQDEQVQMFENAARHLCPGGRFVVEVIVPKWNGFPDGEIGRVFTLDPDHVGIDTLDDPIGQIASSHHWMDVGGRLVKSSAPFRYVWPAELDLMARVAGLRLHARWADWDHSAFSATSESQVVVYEKAARPAD